ncbi:MAG TPA: C40 family peptidase, partial [Candidatus Krumholzibacteria bacterium]|nr:C40 family peptidase [Candidatus Krumholzibacteria bacterium]
MIRRLPPNLPTGALACTGLVLLLAGLGAGCAPKRVVDGQAVYGNETPPPRKPPSRSPATTIPPQASTSVPVEPDSTGQDAPVTPGSVTLGVQAAGLALDQLGKPYRWGASGPDAFDCSGLVVHVFGELGLALPRTASEQAARGQPVSRGDLQPGDLVFFCIDGRAIDHVGIVTDDHTFVHAPRRDLPVTTESLDDDW